MASIQGEVADALVSALKSPAAQASLVAAISSGEVEGELIVDAAINGLKAGGVIGLVLAATKGSIEAELHTLIASYPPDKLAALLTALAVQEAKTLGG